MFDQLWTSEYQDFRKPRNSGSSRVHLEKHGPVPYLGANRRSSFDLTCMPTSLTIRILPRVFIILIEVSMMSFGTYDCSALRTREMELVGHVLTQSPQPMHRSRFGTAFSSFIETASI